MIKCIVYSFLAALPISIFVIALIAKGIIPDAWEINGQYIQAFAVLLASLWAVLFQGFLICGAGQKMPGYFPSNYDI